MCSVSLKNLPATPYAPDYITASRARPRILGHLFNSVVLVVKCQVNRWCTRKTQLCLGMCLPRLNVSERIFTMLTTASMLYTATKEAKLNAM